jgi:hypothetical protein
VTLCYHGEEADPFRPLEDEMQSMRPDADPGVPPGGAYDQQPQGEPMPEFSCQITVRLETGVRFTLKAKDEEAAREKVEQMIEAGAFELASFSWPKKTEALPDFEAALGEQAATADAIEEA